MTELCEYAANVDIAIARESIRAVGKIALQQYDVNAIVDRLLQFLAMEKDYVTAETLVSISYVLFTGIISHHIVCIFVTTCLAPSDRFLSRTFLGSIHNGAMIAFLSLAVSAVKTSKNQKPSRLLYGCWVNMLRI